MRKLLLFLFAIYVVATVQAQQMTQLQSTDCGKNNVEITYPLKANNIQSATEYEFLVENQQLNYSSAVTKTTNSFTLADLANPVKYNTQYEVKVRTKQGGNMSAYGPPCNISTKPEPITKLIPPDCGASNVNPSQILKADIVANANQYDFEVKNTSLNYTEVISKSTNQFKLIDLVGPLEYNSSYEIRVRSKVGGVYSDFGPKCDIITKHEPVTQLVNADCGAAGVDVTQLLKAMVVPNASEYHFKVEHQQSNYSEVIVKNTMQFKLSELNSPVQACTPYEVSARTKEGSFLTAYGPKCIITTKPENPIITASGPTTFCDGQSVVLTSSGAASYSWNSGETTQSITVTQSGNYKVTVTSTNGCTSQSDPFSVTVKPSPTADAGEGKTIFAGESVQIGSAAVTGNTYLWNPANELSDPTISNPIASPESTINYTLTVTNNNGCSATDEVQITINDLPKLQSSQCGVQNISPTETLASNLIPGATQYEFLIENDSADLSESIFSDDRFFQLTEFNGPIEYKRTYNIKVRVLFNGSYSQYGDVCAVTIGEKGSFCSFDGLLQKMKQNDPGLQQLIDNQNLLIKNYIDNNPQTNHKTIPVVVHVMGTGNLNINYEQIKWQIAALNAAFAANYQNYNQQDIGPNTVNTQIQFCLAQNTTPSGLAWTNTSEPGVMRYLETASSVLDPLSNQLSYPNLTNLTHPTGQGRFPFNMYLNIWIVRYIDGIAIPGVIGFATLPPSNPNPSFDGIVFRADAFGDNSVCGNNFNLPYPEEGKILAHEAGHYLGLYHTFEGGCAGMADADCATAGDYCCDTPPSNYSSGNCSTSQNTCAENIFPWFNRPDQLENYMSYSNDECMNTFTFNQKQRMHGYLDLTTNIRNNLWQQSNLALTGGGGENGCTQCVIAANICYSPNSPCPGVAVDFLTPSGNGLCATSWLWNFGDGSTSTLQNPSHTYSTAGNFTVTLTATGSGQTATQTVTVTVASPTATLSAIGTTTMCAGSAQTSVLVSFTGTPPFTATITNGSVNYPVNTNNPTAIIPVTITNTNPTFTLTEMNDVNCPGTTSGTITFNIVSCCDNLICNGEFEDDQSCPPTIGTNCFTSEHECILNPPPPPGTGYITISTGGVMNNGNWNALNHTPGGQFFMICDVSPTDEKIIWQQTTPNLTSGAQYIFSAYFNNLIIPELTSYNDPLKVPDLILLIDGNTVAGPLSIFLDPDTWVPLKFSYTATTNNPVTLAIRTLTGAANAGKDLAIDDISFRQVSNISAAITASANTSCTSNNGSATVSATGGTLPYTYSWSNGQTTQTVNNLGTGNAFVSVTDANGCLASAGVTINTPPSPSVSVSTNSACEGTNNGSVTANVSGGTSPYSYFWYPLWPWQNVATATGLVTGTYSVLVSDANGCWATGSGIVGSLLPPSVNISIQNTCSGTSNGTATANTSGENGPYTFTWNTSPIQNTQTAIGLSAGTYTVTVTDANGCSTIKSGSITVVNPPIPTAGFTFNEFDNCEEQAVTFTANDNNGTYVWNFGDGSSTVTTTNQTITHIYTIPGYFQVTLTVSNQCGGSASSSQIIYIVPSIGAYNPNCCMKDFVYSNPWNSDNINIDISGTAFYSFKVKGTMTIKSGVTVTFNPGVVISFGPQGKVIVEQGATLILDGATFTSINFTSCSPAIRMMWQGIEVWGTYNSNNSSLQGKIILKNNALVEDAHYGITIGQWKFTPWGNYGFAYWSDYNLWAGGGIIQATNSNFNRNGASIYFEWNKYGLTRSIVNCNFTCKTSGVNSPLLDPYYNTANNPNSYNNSSISFHNPFFPWDLGINNSGKSIVGIAQMATQGIIINNNSFDYVDYGIYSLNGKYNVNGSNFSNVYKGIYIKCTNIAYSGHSINNNSFKTFYNGIVIEGGTYDKIINNKFNAIPPIGIQADNKNGIGLPSTTNFSVIDNTFNRVVNGIFCGNTGTITPSLIGYKNSGNNFIECLRSIQTQDNNDMLIIRCNTHDNPDPSKYYRNWVIGPGYYGPSLATQGQFSSTDEKKPAGNIFNISNPSVRKQILTVPSFYYYAHSSPSDRIPVADGPITINSSSISSSSFQNSCTPTVSPDCNPCNQQAMEQEDIRLSQLQAEYNSIQSNLDEGQTIQLLAAISSNISSNALKTILVDNSPLSDTVLITFIDNTASIPPNVFKDVIIPNSPVTEKTKEHLDLILDSLPSGIAQQIRYAQEVNLNYRTLTAIQREITETEISRQLYLNTLISNYAEVDSTQQIINLLENENTNHAYQMLMGIYLADSNLSAAASKFALLTTTTVEDSIFKILNGLYLNLGLNGRSIWEMDSMEFITVRSIAGWCPESKTVFHARTLLWMITGDTISSCPSPNLRLSQNEEEGIEFEQNINNDFILKRTDEFYLGNNIPNPFDDRTVIPYYIPENSILGKMKIFNVSGTLVAQYELSKGKGEIEVQTGTMINGVYSYSIYIDGQIKQTKKMVVIK